MAKLKSLLQFSGTLDGLSVYTMDGVKEPIVRKKGGPSREKLESTPSCANTLRTGAEFGGRSKTTGLIREAWLSVGTLKDVRCIGNLNKKLVPIQEMDEQSAWGERHVALSKNPQLLEDFELAHLRPFDAVVQNPITYTLSKDLGTARVKIPALLPGINFSPRGSHPFFRVMASLGVVPDVVYRGKAEGYQPAERFAGVLAREAQTDWLVVKTGAPATTLELALPQKPAGSAYSLVLAVGITFGTLGRSGTVEAVKKTGSGKIVAMG